MSSKQVGMSRSQPNVAVSAGRGGWLRGGVYAIVLALFFSTLTGLGPYRALVGLGLIFAVAAVVAGQYSLRAVPRSHWFLYTSLMGLWVVSQFYPAEVINQRAVKNILYALVIAFTISTLPRLVSLKTGAIKKCVGVLVVVISGTVIGHASVFYKEKAATIDRWGPDAALMFTGLFENIHFLGLFCCFSLPILLLGWVWFHRWTARVAVASIIIVDLALLFASSSRSAWLTFALVAALGCLLLLPKRAAWLAISATGVAVWGLISLNLVGVGARVTGLTSNIMKEERVTLWGDTLVALQDSSLRELVFGHGIGGYAYYSPAFSSEERVAHLVFPHNFVLEWLYETGLIGFVLITLGLGYVVLSNLFSNASNLAVRRSQIVLGLTMTAVLLHGFLVLPFFYSRQILFLVTMLVCCSFLINDKPSSRVG